ncbi:MAG: carboxypeptidase-like regulatory domain-containing protein [Solirubrobacterales bacterium]
MTRTLLIHAPALLRAVGPCLALLLLCLGLQVEEARAGGFYRVAECSPGHTGTPDATVQGSTTSYSAATSCASGNWLQVQSAASAPAEASKRWVYTAPPGTRIEGVEADYSLVGDSSPDGNRSFLFVRRNGQAQEEILSIVSLGSTAGTYDSSIQSLGPLAAIGVGLVCSKANGSCGYAPNQLARLAPVEFVMQDTTPPAAPVIAGPAADGEWVAGTTQLAIGDTDVGAGVYRTTVAVDGEELVSDVICAPGQDESGVVGEMAPCDPIELRYMEVDTTSPGFSDGPGNQLRVCTHEYGIGGAGTCATKALRVDNVAPSAPTGLQVAGGGGWRRDNDFDLSWSNPPQPHAPIAAATVEVVGPGGTEVTTVEGPDVESADDIAVPGVGAYTARVYLRDEAGNESPAAAAEVELRFDDTRPPKALPQIANGWISRGELTGGYIQTWLRPRDNEIPPSGIAGYRAVVNAQPDFDPCAGAADSRTCGGPMTEAGVDANGRTLRAADLVEGSNWIHVVPVSGSGMRAAEVGRTELKVDLTDPRSVLSGAGSGWVNRPVELAVRAEDGLSGMEQTDEFPDDDPPRTVLEIDGVIHEDGDADVTAQVTGDGVHGVRFWARDLAGNENDGDGGNSRPGEAQVRLDATPPIAAFANRQDPDDPDRLEAPVSDALSGVASGRISFRRSGEGPWTPLPTVLRGGELVARADSEDMTRGVPYEFKVEAADRAGNTSSSTERLDGTSMVTTGPFRSPAEVDGFAINGRSHAKARYGRNATATGRLVDGMGRPIAGATVDLEESYAAGSRAGTDRITARTDASGRFAVALPKGPTRAVEARFRGDSRYLPSAGSHAALRVRGAVTLRAPRRVREGGRAVFRGRVKARGADIARGGKSLEVQVRIGKRWKTVGRSIRTDGKGRFRLRYRFVADYTRPVRYRFRALVLRERGWPYLPAHSKARRLLVLP